MTKKTPTHLALVESVRFTAFTDDLVEQMRSAGPGIALEGQRCIESGGQVAHWMREKIDAFRIATAKGDAKARTAELLCTVLWIDAHFKNWEKERAEVVRDAKDVLGAIFGGLADAIAEDVKDRVKGKKEDFSQRWYPFGSEHAFDEKAGPHPPRSRRGTKKPRKALSARRKR